MTNLQYTHPRNYGKDSRHCRVCKTTRGLIRKYHLDMCRRCFRERATAIGFVKVRARGDCDARRRVLTSSSFVCSCTCSTVKSLFGVRCRSPRMARKGCGSVRVESVLPSPSSFPERRSGWADARHARTSGSCRLVVSGGGHGSVGAATLLHPGVFARR